MDAVVNLKATLAEVDLVRKALEAYRHDQLAVGDGGATASTDGEVPTHQERRDAKAQAMLAGNLLERLR